MQYDQYGLWKVLNENNFLVFDTSALKFENFKKSYENEKIRKSLRPNPRESITFQIRYIERISELMLSTSRIKIPSIVIDETSKGVDNMGRCNGYKSSLKRFLENSGKSKSILSDINSKDLEVLLLQADDLGISKRDCEVIASATNLNGNIALLSNDHKLVNAILLFAQNNARIRPYSLIGEETYSLKKDPIFAPGEIIKI